MVMTVFQDFGAYVWDVSKMLNLQVLESKINEDSWQRWLTSQADKHSAGPKKTPLPLSACGLHRAAIKYE